MKTTVINKQNSHKYTWGPGCESFVFLDTEGLSVKHEVMPPAAKENLHYHNESKQLFYMLKGEAAFYIDDETVLVKQGESVYIAPKQKHYIKNDSAATIEFLVISQPSTHEDRVDSET
ncbi:MAG TPA: cupin domain-containing protein [Bacteroidia bacterium]|nr:cupin domain-containing protein [Bacteroidia bacterium]